MQEVDYPVLAPSVCVVCEGVPPATAFVDTERSFDPGGYTHLNGRKYLCESCVIEAAVALDLQSEAVAPYQAQVAELTERITQLEADVENYSTVQQAIEALSTRPVVQVENTVEKAIEAAQERKAARAAAAKAAQDALAEQEAAAAAGAAKQAELDQAAADAQQAASAAAVAPPVEEPAPDAPAEAPAGDTPPSPDEAPAS